MLQLGKAASSPVHGWGQPGSLGGGGASLDNPQPSWGNVAATGKPLASGTKLCSLNLACLGRVLGRNFS